VVWSVAVTDGSGTTTGPDGTLGVFRWTTSPSSSPDGLRVGG
jgi:hypothetical protein